LEEVRPFFLVPFPNLCFLPVFCLDFLYLFLIIFPLNRSLLLLMIKQVTRVLFCALVLRLRISSWRPESFVENEKQEIPDSAKVCDKNQFLLLMNFLFFFVIIHQEKVSKAHWHGGNYDSLSVWSNGLGGPFYFSQAQRVKGELTCSEWVFFHHSWFPFICKNNSATQGMQRYSTTRHPWPVQIWKKVQVPFFCFILCSFHTLTYAIKRKK
jgi:hypothetical protein